MFPSVWKGLSNKEHTKNRVLRKYKKNSPNVYQ